MGKIGEYLLAVCFIIAAFIKPLEQFVARGMEMADGDKVSTKGRIAYMGVLIALFTIFFFFASSDSKEGFQDEIKEDFFFTVSKCNPKCSGAYFGKPATFQFSEIKQEGVPCEGDNCPSYGMIKGCKSARTYGGGYAPYTYKCREGIC